MAGSWTEAVGHMAGHSQHKPEKKIRKIEHEKSSNGDHIFTHKHHHPDHHPDEVHTKRGDDEMVEHMLAHAGTPNPGEADADPTAAAGAGLPQMSAAAPPPAAMTPQTPQMAGT